MKQLLLLLISLTTLTSISYASFPVVEPVAENTTNEISINPVEPNIEAPAYGGSPVFGILSMSFAILALILFVGGVGAASAVGADAGAGVLAIIASFILSIMSVVFGGIGFNKSLKGFAIAGFIIGMIELLVWTISLIAGVAAAASTVSYYSY